MRQQIRRGSAERIEVQQDFGSRHCERAFTGRTMNVEDKATTLRAFKTPGSHLSSLQPKLNRVGVLVVVFVVREQKALKENSRSFRHPIRGGPPIDKPPPASGKADLVSTDGIPVIMPSNGCLTIDSIENTNGVGRRATLASPQIATVPPSKTDSYES